MSTGVVFVYAAVITGTATIIGAIIALIARVRDSKSKKRSGPVEVTVGPGGPAIYIVNDNNNSSRSKADAETKRGQTAWAALLIGVGFFLIGGIGLALYYFPPASAQPATPPTPKPGTSAKPHKSQASLTERELTKKAQSRVTDYTAFIKKSQLSRSHRGAEKYFASEVNWGSGHLSRDVVLDKMWGPKGAQKSKVFQTGHIVKLCKTPDTGDYTFEVSVAWKYADKGKQRRLHPKPEIDRISFVDSSHGSLLVRGFVFERGC